MKNRFFATSVITLLLLASAFPLSAAVADPWEALGKFQFGQSREPLALIEAQLRKTAPADYGAIEGKLLEVLKAADTQKDAKRYICRWLGIVGSAKCVPPVAELLTDPDLSHPARMALEVLPAAEAGEALRAALPKLQGKLLVGVIGSLGMRRDAQAVQALGRFVRDADPLVSATAIAALGEIGTEQAAAILQATAVPEGLSRNLARAKITAATHLAKAGAMASAARIFQGLTAAQQPPAIRIAALKGLVGSLPNAEATKLIVDTLQGEDGAMRAATISAYASSNDKALKDNVARELPNMKPAGQLILLGILADQPEVAARQPVLTLLKANPEENVRVAALECLARHGEAGDVPLLVEMASRATGTTRDAARKTLQAMGKPGVDNALVRLIETSDAEGRATVLATLASRRVESALPTLVRLLGGADAQLATEAAKALAVMGKTEQLQAIAKVMVATDNTALRSAAEDAAKGICRRATNLTACATMIVAALEQTTTPAARAALLPVLLYTGGEPGLKAVVQAVQSKEQVVKAAGLRTLVAWPEGSAGPYLIEFARTTPEPSQAIVALRDGCLRLAEMDEVSPKQKVEILRGVLEVAKRPEEKKRALASLADVPTPAALEVMQGCLKDAALQADACKATMKLARNMGGVYPRQAVAALEQLKAQAGVDELRVQIDAAIKAVKNSGQAADGTVLAWLLSGPYTKEGMDGSALFEQSFPPEKGGSTSDWRAVTASKTGLVELNKILRGDNRVAYLRTDITSEKDQDAVLELGSDDGVKAWLGGKLVHGNNAVRPCTPGQDKVKIKLKQGVNPLLLKITQGGGEWAACARVRGVDGKPLPDVVIAPNAQ